MALQTVTVQPGGGPFRRNGRRQPLVIQGPIGTRTGPFTAADEVPYFRASGVKDLIEDKEGVATWNTRGSMWAVGHDESLRLSVGAVEDWEADEGKARMRELHKRAEVISGIEDKREGGTALHALFTRIDRGEPLPGTLADTHRYAIEAYREICGLFVVQEIELTVVCDALGVGGNLDKIVSPRGVMIPKDRKGRQFAAEVTPDQRVVGDVKTSQDANYFGPFAAQLAPYANGIAYREEEDPAVLQAQMDSGVDAWLQDARLARVKAVHRTPINVRTDVALLIHVPFKGAHAQLFWFDLIAGYAAAQHAMGTRALRSQWRHWYAPADPPVVEVALQPGEICPKHGAHPGTVDCVDCIYTDGNVSGVPTSHAGAIFGSIKAQNDHARLLEWIDKCMSETELLELWRTNYRVWTDAHNAAAGARSAFLAGTAVAS